MVCVYFFLSVYALQSLLHYCHVFICDVCRFVDVPSKTLHRASAEIRRRMIFRPWFLCINIVITYILLITILLKGSFIVFHIIWPSAEVVQFVFWSASSCAFMQKVVLRFLFFFFTFLLVMVAM